MQADSKVPDANADSERKLSRRIFDGVSNRDQCWTLAEVWTTYSFAPKRPGAHADTLVALAGQAITAVDGWGFSGSMSRSLITRAARSLGTSPQRASS